MLYLSSRLESSRRLFFGSLLWAISATLTLLLLVYLGDGTLFSKVLLGAVSIALEGSNILGWRKIEKSMGSAYSDGNQCYSLYLITSKVL
jgi:hypothetical protein